MLVSVCTGPGTVEFESSPGKTEKFLTSETVCLFEIEHLHGTVLVEVEDGDLAVRWPKITERPYRNIPVNIAYRSRSETYLYPEMTIHLHGPVSVRKV